MNALAPLAGGVPAAFAGQTLPDMNAAASQGLSAGFAVIGYKGRNWRIKYRGEEELLKGPDGVPVAILPSVIVGISPNISKQFYDKRYSEGDDAAPDCFSLNGATPDPQSPKPQCQTCAACPQNVFGSRITEAGKKAKACQDSRRVAVVPLGDIENASYGGPMLLRLPPMSLPNLASFSREIGRYGAQPYMVATNIGFNYDVAYPEITFAAARWLTEDEAKRVVGAMGDPQVERILSSTSEQEAAPAPAPSALSQGGPPAAFQAPPPAPPAMQAPPPAAVPTPTVVAQPAAPASAKPPSAFATPVSPVTNPPAPVAAAPAVQAQPAQPPTAVPAAPDSMEAAIDALLS